jgi:hypothetical protein
MHWSVGDVIAGVASLISFLAVSHQISKDRKDAALQQAQEMTVLTAAVSRLDATMQVHNRTIESLATSNAEVQTSLRFMNKLLDQLMQQRFKAT